MDIGLGFFSKRRGWTATSGRWNSGGSGLFYLLSFYHRIDADLRRSIAITAAMSLGCFIVTFRLIPVAARYVLRKNLFGYDINKKGLPRA